MQKKEEWQKLVKEAYGFSEEQLAAEYDRLAENAEAEVRTSGDYEMIRKRIEESEREK